MYTLLKKGHQKRIFELRFWHFTNNIHSIDLVYYVAIFQYVLFKKFHRDIFFCLLLKTLANQEKYFIERRDNFYSMSPTRTPKYFLVPDTFPKRHHFKSLQVII